MGLGLWKVKQGDDRGGGWKLSVMNCDAELELGDPRTGDTRTGKTELELGGPRTGHTRTGKTKLEADVPWIGF